MERISLIGITVDLLTMDGLHELIDDAITNDKRIVIANHNLHSIYLYHHHPRMRAFYRLSKFTHIDGMPLVLFAKLIGHRASSAHRVTYADWARPLMAMAAARGWRVFYLGSKPKVLEAGVQRLCREFDSLKIRAFHGYFDPSSDSGDNQAVLDEIALWRPHLLLVGMGMPRQEYWILDNYENLQANVILTAGACMDYIANVVPTPPRLLGRLGLEWLCRLVAEPKRLWRRYLCEPWFLIPFLVNDLRAPGKQRTKSAIDPKADGRLPKVPPVHRPDRANHKH